MLLTKIYIMIVKHLRRRKSVYTNLLILFITILVCLVFLEIFLRYLYPVEYSLEQMPILSDYGVFLRVPNFEYEYKISETSQIIKLNSKGIRDYEYGYMKNDSVYRIVVIGDSFVQGSQVRLEDTTPKRLEKFLNENQTKSYEVINFGFDGYGPIPEAILIEEEIMKYNPDLVILGYDISNDIQLLGWGAYAVFPDDFWTTEKHDLLKKEFYHTTTDTKIRNYLRRHSMVYFLLKKTIRSLKRDPSYDLINDRYNINQAYIKEYDPEIERNLNTTRFIFKFLKEYTQKNNVSFVVVVIPAKEQVDLDIFNDILTKNNKTTENYELEKPQRLIDEELEKLNITYIDLLPHFRENNINNTFYWKIDGHFNKQGNDFAARLIYEKLLNDTLIDLKVKVHNRS